MENSVKYPNLRAEMAKRGDTQKTLAELLGLTIATISRKLAGKVVWSLGEVDIICEHYGKNYYELFK